MGRPNSRVVEQQDRWEPTDGPSSWWPGGLLSDMGYAINDTDDEDDEDDERGYSMF